MTICVRRITAGTAPSLQPAVISVGNFDGVHKGHQVLLSRLCKEKTAHGLRSIIVSFYPHPGLVLGKFPKLEVLSGLRKKVALFQEYGVDELVLIRFHRQLAQMSAANFIDEVLVRRLGLQRLVMGPDACFGRGREGTPDVISELLSQRRLVCFRESVFAQSGQAVSSSRIRAVVKAGDVAQASALLGRHYSLLGRVKAGAGRGASIGFPTANVCPGRQALPINGVYACRAILDGKSYDAVTNIGTRPTFGGTQIEIEAHLIDQPQLNLYGRLLEVQFVERLREERKFAAVSDLIAQIKNDIDRARHLL